MLINALIRAHFFVRPAMRGDSEANRPPKPQVSHLRAH